MDQLDPFPEDFCLLPYNQPMSAQALRQTGALCQMTSSEDFVINCIYQQIWVLV
jgi:hypothetical protein